MTSRKTSAGKIRGLTLLEVLVVLAVLAIIAGMLFPTSPGKRSAKAAVCFSQLHQMGLRLNIFADEHEGHFPMQLPASNEGSSGFTYRGQTFPYFQSFTNFSFSPRSFICPFDPDRQPAPSYAALTDQNLSYFLNADASATQDPARSILSGDRCLQVNGRPVPPGLFVLAANARASWAGAHGRGGNLAFADGHATLARDNVLDDYIHSQPLATNRLCVP